MINAFLRKKRKQYVECNIFYRIANWFLQKHTPFIPKLVTLLIFLIYNSKIPYQAKIGKGSKFGYGGIGVSLFMIEL